MKNSRLQEMGEYIAECESVRLIDLCERFDISMSTLRRDLDILAAENRIIKTYGCVSAIPQINSGPMLHARNTLFMAEKKKIGQIAAGFIEDRDTIFIDSGSTVSHLVNSIDPWKKVTIITNNLDVVICCLSNDNLDTYVLPGKLYRENNSFSYLGNDDIYKSYNINKVFMSCTGVDLVYGISHMDANERIAKRYAMNCTHNRFLLVDSSKFNLVMPLNICPIKEFGTICTNERPPEEYVRYCEENGIRLQYELQSNGDTD